MIAVGPGDTGGTGRGWSGLPGTETALSGGLGTQLQLSFPVPKENILRVLRKGGLISSVICIVVFIR